MVRGRRPGASTRRCSSTRCTSGSRRAGRELIFALSVAMVAYTGIETVSNMAEEARDPGARRAQGGEPRALRRARGLRRHLGRRAVGPAGDPGRARPLHDAAGHEVRERPRARHRRARSGSATVVTTALQLLRRRPGRDDPVHRDERRADRHLAALVVARRAPPAAARSSRALHPRYRTPCVHDRLSSRSSRRCCSSRARPTSSATSTRFGAMLSFTTAHVAVVALRLQGARPASARTGRPGTSASAAAGAADGGARGDRHVRRLGLGRRRCTTRRGPSASAWMAVGMAGYFVYRRHAGPRPDDGGADRPRDAAARLRASWPTARRSCRSSAPT